MIARQGFALERGRLRSAATILRALARAKRGAAALEFALVAPVLFVLLIGVFDMGQMMYGQTLLNGAVQHAARAATLETTSTSRVDAQVKAIISPVLPGVTVTSTRTNYYDFNDIARPEKWNDTNTNATCDNSETYVDENGNGSWDRDVGVSGNGGANDVVVYKVTARYTPVFKVPFMSNQWQQMSLSSTSVKKNQPFATQAQYGSAAGSCT